MAGDKCEDQFLSMSDSQREELLERFLQALSSNTRGAYIGYMHNKASQVNADSLIGLNEIVHSVTGYLVQYHRDPARLSPRHIWGTILDKARIWKIEDPVIELLKEGVEISCNTAPKKAAESAVKPNIANSKSSPPSDDRPKVSSK